MKFLNLVVLLTVILVLCHFTHGGMGEYEESREESEGGGLGGWRRKRSIKKEDYVVKLSHKDAKSFAARDD